MTSGAQSITVAPNGQTLKLSVPTGGNASVIFNALPSSAVNGATITGWQWTVTGQPPAATQTFTRIFSAGSYNVSLVVTDSRNVPSTAAAGKVVVAEQGTLPPIHEHPSPVPHVDVARQQRPGVSDRRRYGFLKHDDQHSGVVCIRKPVCGATPVTVRASKRNRQPSEGTPALAGRWACSDRWSAEAV